MQTIQKTVAKIAFDKRKNLIEFFKNELVNLGTDSLSELSRKLNQAGIEISPQKLWRWNQQDKKDIPDWDDLENLAQWKNTPLPEFLVKYLGYSAPSNIANLEASMEMLSTEELADLLLKGNMLLTKRLSIKPMRTTPEQVKLLQQIIIQLMIKGVRHIAIAEAAGVTPSDITAVARDPQGLSFDLQDFRKILLAIASLEGNQEIQRILESTKDQCQAIDLALKSLLDNTNGAIAH